jgi:hypothetical protein
MALAFVQVLCYFGVFGADTAVAADFSYTGSAQTFTVPANGYYKVELWGAQGGHSTCNDKICGAGGKGAYTSGVIYLNADDQYYVFVGGMAPIPEMNVNNGRGGRGGYNGGGNGGDDYEGSASWNDDKGGGGGGATDLRLINADWNDTVSLRSRIMVASGGGGAVHWSGYGGIGVGAGLYGPAATQTGGCAFGHGCQGLNGGAGTEGGGGGGGGYYGGKIIGKIGYGGSSYISGYLGSVAVESDADTTPRYASDGTTGCDNTNALTDLTCSIHYSGQMFLPFTTSMTAGDGVMPNPDGGEMTGRAGNGFARINPTSLDDTFSYASHTPKISTTSAGDTMTVTGDFTHADPSINGSTVISFVSPDGETGYATDIVKVDDNTLTLTIPPHHAGVTDMVITIYDQPETIADALTYTSSISVALDKINIDIGAYISFAAPSVISTDVQTVTITTDNYYGYTFSIAMSTADNRLTDSTTDVIPQYLLPTNPATHPATLSPDSWGLSVNYPAVTTSATLRDTYVPVPAKDGVPISLTAGPSSIVSSREDVYTMTYGVNVSAAGSYRGVIVYTVETN